MTDKKQDFTNHFPFLTAVRPTDIIKFLNYASDTQFHRDRKRFKLTKSTLLTEQMGGRGAKYSTRAASEFVDNILEHRKTSKKEKVSLVQLSAELNSLRDLTDKRLTKHYARLEQHDLDIARLSQNFFDLQNVPDMVKSQGDHLLHLIAKQQEQLEQQALIIERLTSAVDMLQVGLQNLKDLKKFTPDSEAPANTKPVAVGATPKDFIKC